MLPRLIWSPRNLLGTTILLGGIFALLKFSTLVAQPGTAFHRVKQIDTHSSASSGPGCSPQAWNSGRWSRRTTPWTTKMAAASVQDVLEFEGFEGCTSDREHTWHFSGDETQWSRFPEVTSYEWTPSGECDVRQFDRELVIRDMVEQGGWLLIGDSVTENHFFSLSCLLYPHVRTTPNFTALGYYEHDWPQHMYLHPSSPLVSHLQFPEGFNISSTPLVTFRRADLLLTTDELRSLHKNFHPERAQRAAFELMGGALVFNLPVWEYLTLFTAPLPDANYGTLILSTGGHWTTGTFQGLQDHSMRSDGIDNVIEFFGEAMLVWAGIVQAWLTQQDQLRKASVKALARLGPNSPLAGLHSRGGGAYTKGGRKRQVIARAYLPGHDRCHTFHHPWERYEQDN